MAQTSTQKQAIAGAFQDAEIILRLYDLRREDKMRKARHWFQTRFKANNLDEFQKQTPPLKPMLTFEMSSTIGKWPVCLFPEESSMKRCFSRPAGSCFRSGKKSGPFSRMCEKPAKTHSSLNTLSRSPVVTLIGSTVKRLALTTGSSASIDRNSLTASGMKEDG